MYTKLISGNRTRKTRLHDEKGNLVSIKKMLFHGPKALTTGILRLIFGYRPSLPWISYSAIKEIKKHLNKENSSVLEFGSGMSTIWYAKNSKEVFSVEDNRTWYLKIENEFKKLKIKNVNYTLLEEENEYYKFMCDKEMKFDLIMIDGSYRSSCMKNTINMLKSGGMLYLDNSDKDSIKGVGGDMRIAEELAIDFAKKMGAQITYFTDFAPTQLFVQQGLLIKLK